MAQSRLKSQRVQFISLPMGKRGQIAAFIKARCIFYMVVMAAGSWCAPTRRGRNVYAFSQQYAEMLREWRFRFIMRAKKSRFFTCAENFLTDGPLRKARLEGALASPPVGWGGRPECQAVAPRPISAVLLRPLPPQSERSFTGHPVSRLLPIPMHRRRKKLIAIAAGILRSVHSLVGVPDHIVEC